MEEATFSRTDNGKYTVKLAFQTHKLRADGKGIETEIDHNDWIEIGIFGEKIRGGKAVETTLYQEKYQLKSGSGEIEITIDEKPVRAGIDPRNLLIDRVPEDNTKSVRFQKKCDI
jgi:ABC-2 type transport system permease protein